MPYARISLHRGKAPDYLRQLSSKVHEALVAEFDVPPTDRFQVIHQLEKGELVYDPDYLGGPRTDDFVLIAITAGRPRSNACKQRLYRTLVEGLHASIGLDPENVMVVITTTEADEWSFGGGRGNG